jgi:hypothetical protein
VGASLVGPIFGVNVLCSLYRLESGAVKAGALTAEDLFAESRCEDTNT